MTTIAPNKVVLTCTVTGKTVTWTNKKIIQKKIDQFGSLEAFQSQFKCKGAVKKKKIERVVALKPILHQGVALGALTPEEYHAKYMTVTRTYNDGTNCTVVSPKVLV